MKTILKWIFIGPIVLLCSIPIDSCIFVYNLYTKEDEHCACGATAAVEEIGSIEKKALKILVDCCDLTIKQVNPLKKLKKTLSVVKASKLMSNVQNSLNVLKNV